VLRGFCVRNHGRRALSSVFRGPRACRRLGARRQLPGPGPGGTCGPWPEAAPGGSLRGSTGRRRGVCVDTRKVFWRCGMGLTNSMEYGIISTWPGCCVGSHALHPPSPRYSSARQLIPEALDQCTDLSYTVNEKAAGLGRDLGRLFCRALRRPGPRRSASLQGEMSKAIHPVSSKEARKMRAHRNPRKAVAIAALIVACVACVLLAVPRSASADGQDVELVYSNGEGGTSGGGEWRELPDQTGRLPLDRDPVPSGKGQDYAPPDGQDEGQPWVQQAQALITRLVRVIGDRFSGLF